MILIGEQKTTFENGGHLLQFEHIVLILQDGLAKILQIGNRSPQLLIKISGKVFMMKQQLFLG